MVAVALIAVHLRQRARSSASAECDRSIARPCIERPISSTRRAPSREG